MIMIMIMMIMKIIIMKQKKKKKEEEEEGVPDKEAEEDVPVTESRWTWIHMSTVTGEKTGMCVHTSTSLSDVYREEKGGVDDPHHRTISTAVGSPPASQRSSLSSSVS